ncbi:SMI1/KNR4 family protein [Actinopolyspora alba]|uniref:SMI1/KNR4 family protein n=1 Tax=Actinopolyspora alba TaxID=673379 RepID=UPI001587C754|nr:SMI1/KNR4 family protein [Actinopolyspora alba]
MSDVDEFVRLVVANSHLANHYASPPDAELINWAESSVGLKLPPTFRRYLETLGGCDLPGEEIYGLFRDRSDDSVVHGFSEETLESRRDIVNFPGFLIPFMEDGMGGFYVMDTSQADASGEAPVYIWTPEFKDSPGEYVGQDFGEVALMMASRAIASEDVE